MDTHEWLGKPSSICTCGWAPVGIAWPSLAEAWRTHVAERAGQEVLW